MLLNEMSSRENAKRGGPGIVARLMGMDTSPPETGPTIYLKECSNESSKQYTSRMTRYESTKILPSSHLSTTFKKSDDKLPLNYKLQYPRQSTKSLNSAKPLLREHPQEDQLQKFKKEFEAWEKSKLLEFSSNSDQNNCNKGFECEKILELRNHNKEKMAGNTNICTSVNKLKLNPNQFHDFQHDLNFSMQSQTKDDMAMRRELASKSFEHKSAAKFHEKRNTPCSPSRIVILKSFSDINDEMEGPRGGSPKVLEKCNSIEDFLKEVKKRLKLELEGKGKNDSIRKMSAAHTSSTLQESSTDSKHITWEVGKRIKENTTANLAERLGRSESLRSYGNEFHFHGQVLPEVIKEETRNFISDRLKNVLKDDSELEKTTLDNGRGGKFLPANEKARLKSINSFSKTRDGFWDQKEAVNCPIPNHFRHGQLKMEPVDVKVLSPPNFIRSFSVPASRSTFEQAFLNDHHTAEAQSFQLLESSENESTDVNKRKKDGFSIKGKVSNLKRTLGLKGFFFGKKESSVQESTTDTAHFMDPNQSMPMVVRDFVVQDNSTEVPPTPASFLSSPMSEFHSPVSPLEVPFIEDHLSTQVSDELSMNLRESKRLKEDIECKRNGVETASELHDSNDLMTLIEDHGEVYVRDVLLLSGLYRAWPSDQVISRMEGQLKPISSCVFDDLEDKNYKKLGRYLDDDYSSINLGNIILDRKLLFDLVNQALLTMIEAPTNRLMFESWTRSLAQLPNGRKLLGDLLHQIQIYTNPKAVQSQSVEDIVVRDVKVMPLCTVSREDFSSLGREFERVIIEDLIDELVLDLSVRLCYMVQ